MSVALPAVTGSTTVKREYRLARNLLYAMTYQAKAAYPREACGLVVSGSLIVARNVAQEPEHQFSIDPDTLKLAGKMIARGARLEAIWHSHPNGLMELSAGDKAGAVVGGRALYPNVAYVVVAMVENPLKAKEFFTSATAWAWLGDARDPTPLKLVVHSG